MKKSANGIAPKIQRYSTSLKVQLTAAELADRSDRAAQTIADRDAKEADMKAVQQHAKSELAQLEATLRLLLGEVKSRATYRPVDCERRYDYERCVVEEVRLDTGEIIDSRAMNGSERQMQLPFGDGEGQ